MPILPLDHPEPFAATLGVMLYPGVDNDDPLKARAFASQYLATPIRRLEETGYKISRDDLLRIAMDAGQPLDDLNKRWWGGRATGESFKALWALSNTDPALATWNNAVKIAELVAARAGTSGSRSLLWEARRRFLSVAHLWAARAIREAIFDPQRGYADYQSFLAEAEILRDFGQTWRPARANSKPLLPLVDVWKMPDNWKPEIPDSAELPRVPLLVLPDAMLSLLNRAGRPRKAREN